MIQYLTSYICTLFSILILDYIWLGLIMKNNINRRLGHLMLEKIKWGPALLFYTLYAGAVVYFCVLPAVATGNRKKAIINGLLLGLTAYMTYDLTNRSTLKNWPVSLVVPDIMWGGVVTAIAALAGFYVWRAFA